MQFIKYLNSEFKNWKKKTWKISESGCYFQILTHDNYEQTNGIQLELFCASPMLGILQQTKELSTTHIFFEKSQNFKIKIWKKPWKVLSLFFKFWDTQAIKWDTQSSEELFLISYNYFILRKETIIAFPRKIVIL